MSFYLYPFFKVWVLEPTLPIRKLFVLPHPWDFPAHRNSHLRYASPLRSGTDLRHSAKHLACRVLTAFRLFSVSLSVVGDIHAHHFPARHFLRQRLMATFETGTPLYPLRESSWVHPWDQGFLYCMGIVNGDRGERTPDPCCTSLLLLG